MLMLSEIEQKYIKPLSRLEKLQLIVDITKMLQEEEKADTFFKEGKTYSVFTPTIAPDDSAYSAAFQLQQLLDSSQNEISL